MFYVEPSLWWTQFARTGDRRFFEFGEANARHHMDVDTCHFTEMATSGLACAFNHDESGIIHWSIYQHTINSTANYLPYLTAYYYQTGYERARDVALEVGAMILSQLALNGFPLYKDRGAGRALWAAVELAEITANADFLALAEPHRARPGRGPGLSGVRRYLYRRWGAFPRPADFTLAYVFPGAIAYHRGTHDPAPRPGSSPGDVHRTLSRSSSTRSHFTLWQGMAYAYQLSGDATVLSAARWNLDRSPNTRIRM